VDHRLSSALGEDCASLFHLRGVSAGDEEELVGFEVGLVADDSVLRDSKARERSGEHARPAADRRAKGAALRAVKGAFAVVSKLAEASATAAAAADELEGKGFRVLAVAVGGTTLKLAGLIALSDPPRPDAANLIKKLKALGVRTVMVTGDAPATAKIIANEVGLEGAICPPGSIPANVRPEAFAVFAGVMPEDKFHLVQGFQKAGHTVGMCGDGANDAPALRRPSEIIDPLMEIAGPRRWLLGQDAWGGRSSGEVQAAA
jgi:high-affinity K+ transport system ATPase subunit B